MQRFAKRLVSAVLLSITLVGCGDIGSALESDGVPISEIITLARLHTGALRVNTVDTLEAEIPAESSENVVTFSTTTGTFLESADKSLAVRAARSSSSAEKLIARVVLLAPADTATAYVRATIKTYYAAVTIPVVK